MKSEFKNYLRRKAIIDEEIRKLEQKIESLTYDVYNEDDLDIVHTMTNEIDCYKNKRNQLMLELQKLEDDLMY